MRPLVFPSRQAELSHARAHRRKSSGHNVAPFEQVLEEVVAWIQNEWKGPVKIALPGEVPPPEELPPRKRMPSKVCKPHAQQSLKYC